MRMASSALTLCVMAGPALSEPPQVVTDIAITGSLVQMVMGDLAEPTVLTGATDDPHQTVLRPSGAQALQDADLLVWIGPELTAWLSDASKTMVSGQQLRLLEVEGTRVMTYGESAHHAEPEGHDHATHDEEHDHQGEEHEEEDHDGEHHHHNHDGTDPHAWLDPNNARIWLHTISEKLSELDPDNAQTYQANADQAADRIAKLDARVAATLEGARQKQVVVFHDAYRYFTGHYGLQPAIAVALGDATSPSAARLAEIRNTLAQSDTACALPEFGNDVALIENVTEGLGIELGQVLDPAGRNLDRGAELYPHVIEAMGASFADCVRAD